MRFNYQARNDKGEVKAGVVEASSREAALDVLRKYDLYVTILEQAGGEPIYARKIKLFERIGLKDIFLFSQQLSILFASKVPLVESLTTLAGQIKRSEFREKIIKISEEIRGGMAFSSALYKYPRVFSPFYIAMVRAGEASGKLSDSLSYLAKHLEREYQLRAKVIGAMIYPILIIVVAIAVLILMMLFVVPSLVQVLTETSQELPLVTRIVINFSDFFRHWGWTLGLGFVVSLVFFARYYQSPSGRRFFDRFFLQLPLFGNLLKTVYLSRFAENLSTSISSGIPITQSLEITEDIVENVVYKEIISQTRDGVKKGETISSVLIQYPKYFSSVFIQMVTVGERTGTLDKTLLSLVDFYQKEVDGTVNNLVSILEPSLIIILGVIVGGIIVSILMPLYQTLNIAG